MAPSEIFRRRTPNEFDTSSARQRQRFAPHLEDTRMDRDLYHLDLVIAAAVAFAVLALAA